MKIVQKTRLLSSLLLFAGGLFADGLQYAVTVHQKSGLEQKTHVLSIDIKKMYSLRLGHAVGDVCSREELSTMGLRHKPTVATTIGSVRRGGRYNGCPNELLIIDSYAQSDAGLFRPTLILDAAEGTIEIKQQKIYWQVGIGELSISIDRINQPATADNEVVLYNPLFGRDTRTAPQGLELVIERGKLNQVWSEWGNARIPSQGYVLHIGSKHPLANINWQNYLTKSCVSPSTATIDLQRDNVYGVQGLLMLVDQGRVVGNWEQQFAVSGFPTRLADEAGLDLNNKATRGTFVAQAHAHTALGLTADGLLKIVTVEGAGATLDEVAKLMLGVGCVTAMLASSGGDVGLWYQDRLVTTPVGEELPIGTALLLFENPPLE